MGLPVTSRDLTLLELAPEVSTQMWSTILVEPSVMTTALQRQHCNAFTCILLKNDVAHSWCIHAGRPTLRSGAKSVNKVFQANKEHGVLFNSMVVVVVRFWFCGFFFCLFVCVFLKYINCVASQLIKHVLFVVVFFS